jgi:hypothetical protein
MSVSGERAKLLATEPLDSLDTVCVALHRPERGRRREKPSHVRTAKKAEKRLLFRGFVYFILGGEYAWLPVCKRNTARNHASITYYFFNDFLIL